MVRFFPTLKGLGHSALAQHFGFAFRDEAQACWQHPVLAARLRQCIERVLVIEEKSALKIFGATAGLKFHACLTLFAQEAPQESLFGRELAKYFSGVPDPGSLELL